MVPSYLKNQNYIMMKKREFLGKTLVGSAGVAIGASGLLASSCKGANDRIVLALIGEGLSFTMVHNISYYL